MLGGTEAEQAWGAMYEGDSERAEAHRAKMVIMGEETARACGRRVARSELQLEQNLDFSDKSVS